jgi:uncharacterized protein YidB (DUF937 family)
LEPLRGGNLVGEAEQAAMAGLVEKFSGRKRLQSILAKVNDAGFQTQVHSWLDKNKDNLPTAGEQICKALGDEHVQQITKSLGVPRTRKGTQEMREKKLRTG